jgi:hypothetical protein
MNWIVGVGYLASALVFATFCMRTMVPLRLAAISSNIAFIVYGVYGGIYPVLVLHAVLLPMNIWRTSEMMRLVNKVKAAAKGDLSVDWLKPYMKALHCRPGEVLFRRGDEADRLFLIVTGELVLEEINRTLHPGDLLGEIALFSAKHQRTQTARCNGAVDLVWIGEQELAQLCYQNPAISFHLLRLITNRLIENASRIEQSYGEKPAAG